MVDGHRFLFKQLDRNVYVIQVSMLGLMQGLSNPSGGVVLPGGTLDDGDWVKMTSEDWEAVGDTNWEDWDATADS